MDNSAAGTAASARAALDVARGVFGRMSGAPSDLLAGARSAADTATSRALAAWLAAEAVLHAVTGRADLSGQALVGEARRLDRLTLGDAHVMIALHEWNARQVEADSVVQDVAAPTDAEARVAREALLALEHAVATVTREPARVDARIDARVDAPLGPRDTLRSAVNDFSPTGTRRSGAEPIAQAPKPAPALVGPPARFDTVPGTEHRRGLGAPAVLLGALVLLLVVGGGAWYVINGRGGAPLDDGIAAYARGSREAARLAFTRAVDDEPNDARPLIYLARLAREDGDLPRARRFLDRAIRLDNNSAVAQREMGSTMLADANPDLARRFYVRALEIDPADRLAQGFLACALHRLGRIEDAKRFADRAGPGEWTACLTVPVAPAGTAPGAAPAASGTPTPRAAGVPPAAARQR